MANFARDLRYALRMLAKNPGIAAIIVVTLGLGIGVNAAIFGLVNGFLLRPLPVPSPEQITVLAIQQKGSPVGSSGFSYPEFDDFRKQGETFSDVFALALSSVKLTVNDKTDSCFANYVSGNFFPALRIRAAFGRFILPDEAESPGERPVVVLGYSYWQKRFSGDPGIIGKQVLINSRPATVIGVAEKSFRGMFSIFDTDAFLPIGAMALEEPPNFLFHSRDFRRLLVFGRLKPGVTIPQAQSSLDVIVSRLALQYPATDGDFTVRVIPEKLSRPIPYANNSFVVISGLFLVLAGFILLLACTNVENILLSLAVARNREMGIRAALGASRARLLRQVLTETILLALLGGIAGIVFGAWAGSYSAAIRPQNLPLHLDASLDWRVLVYALGASLAGGILAGIWPALRASSANVISVAHGGGEGFFAGTVNLRLRNFLIVAQVGGSLTLLIVAALFVRSLQKVQTFDLGFDPTHLLNVVLDPQAGGYSQDRTVHFYRDLEAQVRALPGVQSASLASDVPLGGFQSRSQVFIQNRALPRGQQPPSLHFNRVDAPYFRTMGITLLRGRAFTDFDDDTSPMVAIVNQTMAKTYWPAGDAIGKRFSTTSAGGPFLEVIGVVRDGKYQTIAEDPQSYFYVPLAQNFTSKRALQIRSLAQPDSLAAPVKDLAGRLAPDLPILDIETMQEWLNGAFGFFTFRLAAALAGAMGMVGLILAVVGVYGMISFAVTLRTHEIGVRLALGAHPRDILRLIWTQAMRLVVAGVGTGVIAALALTRAMSHFIVGVSTSDPVAYSGVAILICAVAFIACWIPARRAMRVDPIVALRYE